MQQSMSRLDNGKQTTPVEGDSLANGAKALVMERGTAKYLSTYRRGPYVGAADIAPPRETLAKCCSALLFGLTDCPSLAVVGHRLSGRRYGAGAHLLSWKHDCSRVKQLSSQTLQSSRGPKPQADAFVHKILHVCATFPSN